MSSIWEKVKELNFLPWVLPLVPFTSYFSGRGFNALLVAAFGDAKIEDTPTPFFCVTTDLTTSSGFVHRNGSMWRYAPCNSPRCRQNLPASRLHLPAASGTSAPR